ncbi:MAG TPA: transcriptional repressor [Armatimonadetes bacterium]|nr:transcriptional repressor [Armatimonadota bacterium]
MDDYAAQAEERLRAAGYRMTRSRQQVIAALAATDRALSPYALIEHLRAGRPRTTPDVVTVYRVLDLLETLGLAHRVHTVPGWVACTWPETDGCHHHIICAECGRIAEVGGEDLAADLHTAPAGWTVRGHVLEYSGTCPECQVGGAGG